ncbi:hypothetical protein F5B22DRAFT_619782 [Xylaria bambusicola]|uniref:uncharacterized protein n=1 Tax=Xylaria bambusicola TaxID=326684 RepID=UPI00200789D7|nr:uncharacterized protein F5B22DRAFT_619782 [Xylaria bambusicola]KAI0508641.1 hypothetical protein F5B22DRAFT_619782 [Xylaria bambusicola]
MGHNVEEGNSIYHYVSGFGSFSDFIASDEDKSTAVYNQFSRLAARDLVYYQSELAELQALQDQYDIEDAKDVEDLQKLDLGSIIRAHTRDWVTFKHSAWGQSRPNTHLVPDERWKKRMDLAMEIRATLKDYQEALIRQSTLASLPRPSRQTMTALSNYFHTRAVVPHATPSAAQQQTTTTYPILTGASSKLYATGMTEAQIRLSDYISLSRPAEAEDPLTHFLKTYCSCLFRERIEPLEFPSRAISHLSARQVVRYSLTRIQLAVSFITTFFAAVLLFLPIAVLPISSSQHETLGLIALFVALFAIAIMLMTNARRAEVFGACAAYAAVLVVFISGDFAGGGNK